MDNKELKDRITEITKDVDKDIGATIQKGILALIHRVKFPDNYCPKCGKRMFFSEDEFVCECGYSNKKKEEATEVLPQSIPVNENTSNRAANMADLAKKMESGESVVKKSETPRGSGPVPGASSQNVKWV